MIVDIHSENVLRIYRSDDVSDKLTISTVTNILNDIEIEEDYQFYMTVCQVLS